MATLLRNVHNLSTLIEVKGESDTIFWPWLEGGNLLLRALLLYIMI